MSIYDFEATLENGTTYSLDKYKGKVVVIVNTATKCGLSPQFEGLENLYKQYESQGLVMLGFPSDQFKQELATGEEAAEACRTTYGVTFPMHQIIKVNGKEADPLFNYLTEHTKGVLGKSIKWNFTKFLVDRDGNVVERFAPKDQPEKMVPEIEKLLGESVQS